MSSSPPTDLHALEERIPRCTRCPELRTYGAEVGRVKRKAFQDWDYWARPVPGFGDPAARLWIIGLAPAAHGGNRTGRMFTGDRSGDFLYAALHRTGLANQPSSTSRLDGLELHGVYISAALRCAPPANKPSPEELDHCRPYLVQEYAFLKNVRAVLALGRIAWDTALQVLGAPPASRGAPRPTFAHGAAVPLGRATLLGSYHVSQQNTFTGRLTPAMLDAVLTRAQSL